jgi:hypothetical protein
MGLCAAAAVSILGLADYHYLLSVGRVPPLKEIWWLGGIVPLACGAMVTLGCGGAALGRRIVAATLCGIAVGLLYTAVSLILGSGSIGAAGALTQCLWRVFVFAVVSTIGALTAELSLPDPDLT